MATGGKDQFYKEVASALNKSAYHLLYPVTKLWIRNGTEQADIERKQAKVLEEIDTLVKAHLQQFLKSEVAEVDEISRQIEKDDQELRSLEKMLDIDAVEYPTGLKKLQQGQWIATEVTRLREEKKKRMRDYLHVVNKKVELEKLLGVAPTEFDTEAVPSANTKRKLNKLMHDLTQEKEFRENQIYTMTERITCLIGILGHDLNASSINSFISDDGLFTLHIKDVKRVQKSLADLENAKKMKTEEVRGMLDVIQTLYIRLEVPQNEQLALASGSVCGFEELLCGDNYQEILDELRRMETLKKENIGFLMSKSKNRLEILQENVLLSTSEKRLFWDKLEPSNQSLEVTLDLLGEEIARLTEIWCENEAGLECVWELVELSRLADNLLHRMNDPNRLFKARGNQMFQEEADRKKVNQIPKKCEKLLQTDFSLTIFGEPLEAFIAKIDEKMLDYNGRKPQGKKPAAKGKSQTITGATRSSQRTTGLCKATSLMSSTPSSNLIETRSTSTLTRSSRAGGGGNRQRADAATPLTATSSSMGTRARRRVGEEGVDRRGGLVVPLTTVRPPSTEDLRAGFNDINFAECCNSTEIYGARPRRMPDAAAMVDNNNASTLIAGLLKPEPRRVGGGSPSLARHKNRKGHRRSQSVGDFSQFRPQMQVQSIGKAHNRN